MKVHIHYKVNWRLKWNSLRQREKYNKVENHKNKRIQDEVAKRHSSLKTEVYLLPSYLVLVIILDEMYPAFAIILEWKINLLLFILYIFQKYGKFWSIAYGRFSSSKNIFIFEECLCVRMICRVEFNLAERSTFSFCCCFLISKGFYIVFLFKLE